MAMLRRIAFPWGPAIVAIGVVIKLELEYGRAAAALGVLRVLLCTVVVAVSEGRMSGRWWRCDVYDFRTGDYKGSAFGTLSNLLLAFRRWHTLTEWPNTREPSGVFSRQVEVPIEPLKDAKEAK